MAAALTELAARRSGEDVTATRAEATRVRALSLAEADARAYEEVLAAQGAVRSAALERADDILHEIAAAASEVRGQAAPLVDTIEGALRGEALAAVELAEAARRVVEQLILVNQDGATDEMGS